MPHQVKARAEMVARFNALRKKTRRPSFDGSAIVLGAKGGITRKKIGQVIYRLKKKKELLKGEKVKSIDSVDNVSLVKGLNLRAVDVTTRFSLKYLMRPFEHTKVSSEQKRLIEELILNRVQPIKGTNISIRTPKMFLLIELANTFGEKGIEKAAKLAEKLAQRGKTLVKLNTKSRKYSDVFINIHQIMANSEQMYTMLGPEYLAKEALKDLSKREAELKRLSQMDIPQKERYVALLTKQIRKARINYIQYRQNNL